VVVTTIHNQVAKIESDVTHSDRDEVLEWLCPHDYSKQLKVNVDLHQEGTGQWFLNDQIFMDWQNSEDSSTLFCPGAPGTGKTVMSAQAVIHLQRTLDDTHKPVLYVPCDYRRRADQTIDRLFASLVRQLGFSSWMVFQRLKALCSKCKNENSRPVRKDLEKELEEALRLVGAIYIVIDALDECDKEPRSMLINELKKLSSKSTIHLLVTARGESDIEVLFEGNFRLPIKATEGDIELYAKERGNHFEQDLVSNQELRDKVVRAVIGASEGM
jgi:hypothetical protein